MEKICLLLVVLLSFIVNSVQANMPVTHKDFLETFLNICLNSCDENVLNVVNKYKTAGKIELPRNYSIYLGECDLPYSKGYASGAFGLLVIEKKLDKFYSMIKFSGPRYDYNGTLRQNSWQETSTEKILKDMDGVMGIDLFELRSEKRFNYINTDYLDSNLKFITWLRGDKDNTDIYAMGYWASAPYFCKFSLSVLE